MDALPSETVLYILSLLDPLEIVNIQLVSRRFFRIARDSKLWRSLCFQTSYWEELRQKRDLILQSHEWDFQESSLIRDFTRIPSSSSHGVPSRQIKANERRTRILANWDPSYSDEQVDWYTEYIQRSGPIAVNWLEQPQKRDGIHLEPVEVWGAGIYSPPSQRETSIAVGPLDDGSVCLWDLTTSSDKYGRVIGRSTPQTICVSGSTSEVVRSRMINAGVTDCISIDSNQDRAYIAVQSDLIGVDLATLKVVSREKYPFSISAVSETTSTVPIIVGTNLSLHIYDPRTSSLRLASNDPIERLEGGMRVPQNPAYQSFDTIRPMNYAPLFRPGPLCIINMPNSNPISDSSSEIFVAGRFASILQYDWRTFPRLKNTIYSGSRLCSMTSTPFPFTARINDCMRRGELSIEQIKVAKQSRGNTLIACGEYNGKGSLELYGLPSNTSPGYDSTKTQNDEWLKNRQTSSNSKLLSVSTHGTCIVFSDGGGNIKWVERDGFTMVREWTVSSEFNDGPHGIFGPRSNLYMDDNSGEIVRKILHTKPNVSRLQYVDEKDDLVLWTGDKLGILSFSGKSRLINESLEIRAKDVQDLIKEREERAYGENMRRALIRQADEVRFVRGLGLSLDLGQ